MLMRPGHLRYDADFHRVTADMNRYSAKVVVAEVMRLLTVSSVADFGCGQGVWLASWQEAGAEDVAGIDGPYVDRSSLQFSGDDFESRDLAEPIDLGRRFDLVQSLEVAEHLSEARATCFVETLVRHSDIVLFSAAPPGQGGVGHVNEQPYEFWARIFASHHYELFDAIRPLIAARTAVRPWYRYNILLFVNTERIVDLPAEVMKTRILDGQAIPDNSPMLYRIRKALVQSLPVQVQEACAAIAMRLRARSRPTTPMKDCA